MYDLEKTIDRAALDALKAVPFNPSQEGCIPLWVADMDFPAAPAIQEALVARMSKPSYGYTLCRERYYSAVIDWMKRRHRWDVAKEWFVLTPGVVPAMAFAVRALTAPGDKVMIQTPVYPQFAKMVQSNGATLVTNPLKLVDGRYEIDFEDFEQKVKDPALKLFFLCNPHNPVGRVWKRDELHKLAELCLEHDVIIFSDDIHHDFTYGDHQYIPIATLSPDVAARTITATSPSKTFSIASFKMGNIFIEEEGLRQKYQKAVESAGVAELDLGAIEATIGGYTKGEAWFDEALKYIEGNSQYIEQFIADRIPQVKTFAQEGTYLKWLDWRSFGMTDKELNVWALNEAKVWLSEGHAFGKEGSGFMRLNMTSRRAVIEEAMERLARAAERL
ncbi:pyridoxal phosphate-dependent aminotransferase [Paenibacillus thiaminolyticus]|uniref:cysteine-S-conjugate beta-lyase n=1 Tax=Paenibacillus thiaminolyticus TaxID=49283 RepID=A0AAP9DRF5_PANTH|nr:MalY/PatB family protein [Paenibacillus thiaminolyticus]MCY9536028.1 pyridoxal phosphate-dependent aminotransferase [Paenibacillus thiaminolyticus]MCY9602311.1 pyridoxal phosphate-dependent aminotransferase [Paenibacillus thiaminolyticus]MCY9608706.1 pyridoxal phosphate-dependent aminotransferase [Paenibacillus thiaminolyticus]MCY9613452.1 pyridoxal phosphate-dependent aminotransferase [Paenibacillus thiaminolyticus]MCY9620271.1 pyridoxal phosphate-dependent aminotransferase [Paenibacillus 